MSILDWIVLVITLLLIVLYGIYKSRNIKHINGYFLGDKELPWYNVGFSVMATQASAITFLSAPGLAYSSGMSFVQFYFGLPLAMIVICITFVPIFKSLNVYTAYEFLEKRFDVKTRALTAFLFLIQRGISTGITIFAPSIILSTILHIDINYTTLVIGLVVVLYTVYGGSKAVSYTQLLQMAIIFTGLFAAGFMVMHLLPENIGLKEALMIAGKSGKTNAIDFTFDLNNQYTVWTGLIGGFFLQLSYFGTDQSQVGRYLTGASTQESRMGLLMNGLLKVPMQFCILFIGLLVFVYYQFNTAPLFFNPVETTKIEHTSEYQSLLTQQEAIVKEKEIVIDRLVKNTNKQDELYLQELNNKTQDLREQTIEIIKSHNPKADTNDNNYVFLSFVTSTFPKGFVGLLIAIIMLASMGATASAINSLASTTVIDIIKRFFMKNSSDASYLKASRLCTLAWGIFTVIIALYATKIGNLLEAVNILGSLFYGTILGIFLVAFYFKKIGGKAVFWAAIVSEICVVLVWKMDLTAFLWLNLIGCFLVIVLGYAFQYLFEKKKPI